ncbi:peroxiredoxin [Paracoccus suum]|uniref:Glutathione-dependent peroxiredoxin n=1 Tax=Paracoccus suum TaxID=2259340 RepID=A0A344PGP5_9RHOB|nr:peroxiredoxin [Paracoccus suum]AXC48550.1 peroxiredoxin [Paracoccus suum]
MTIKTGDRLPQVTVLKKGADGIESVDLSAIPGRVALFGVPGAFTSTCSNAHMPSFVKASGALRDAGISRIICVTVNDPHVADAWGRQTGAEAAGVEVMADADGSLTRAMGLEFDAPQAGLYGRSKRFSALVRDGVVEVLNLEANPGAFEVSGGDRLLTQV